MGSRKPQHKVADPILNRWSARAMSGELVTKDELMSLFEAARWAPSSYNNQPWRFVYATRDSKDWKKFMDLLVPFNQEWCKNAGALVAIVASKKFTDAIPDPKLVGSPSNTHSFDTGAAWQNFALQGHINGLVVHGMEGLDYDKAKKALNIPDDFALQAIAAVGHPGDANDLPEGMRAYEKPSDRKPVEDLVFEGEFASNVAK